MILLDLENCDVGYSPTFWQRERLPDAYLGKVRVIFDGLDTTLWRPMTGLPRRLGTLTFPKVSNLSATPLAAWNPCADSTFS
jgi:hypothetical protein